MTMQRLTESQKRKVEDYFGLAVSLARKARDKYKTRFSYDEALSAASLGLISAITRHDKNKGKFSTSATCRANGQILDDLRKKYHWLSGAREKIKKTPRQFAESRGGRDEREDFEARPQADMLEQVDSAEKLMECLDDKEKHVIKRVVLDGATLKVVGAEIGLGESGASYVKKGALEKLRNYHGKRD